MKAMRAIRAIVSGNSRVLAGTVALSALLATVSLVHHRGLARELERQLPAALHDPLALIAMRSPGLRDAGALFQTKRLRRSPPARRIVPKERVLPLVREHAPAIEFQSPETLFNEPLIDLVIPVLPVGEVILPGDLTSPVLVDIPVIRPDPVSPAVPEPATWISMIVGFAFLGAALRYRKRVPGRITPA